MTQWVSLFCDSHVNRRTQYENPLPQPKKNGGKDLEGSQRIPCYHKKMFKFFFKVLCLLSGNLVVFFFSCYLSLGMAEEL